MTASEDSPAASGDLTGLSVCSFESRKRAEIGGLLARHGAAVTVAPSMCEVPLDRNPEAFAFAEQLFSGAIDLVIFLTGVGTRALGETLDTMHPRQKFLDALQQTTIIVRGPKPAAVLREWGVRIDHQVPEPNTWRELLALLDERVPVAGRVVAVQEYGQPNPELYAGLSERQARIVPVPVYRWALPENLAPLRGAIEQTIAGRFDVLMFTSAQQVRNVLEVAAAAGCREAWLTAANRCVIASIGPTASETLRHEGLPPDVEPEHPKMGHLVVATARQARDALRHKQAHRATAVPHADSR